MVHKLLTQVEIAGGDCPAHCNITWAHVPGKGRGVVATKDIKAGTLVENSPVIIMPMAVVDNTPLDDYVWWWSDDNGGEYAVGAGFLMLYNHSSAPNVTAEYDYQAKTVKIIALVDIARGAELCWDYKIDLWFKPA